MLSACGGGKGGSSPAAGPAPAPVPVPTPTAVAEVFGPDVMTVKQFYRPEHGKNMQPAFQEAINRAQGTGKKLVSDFGAVSGEMWAPVRHNGFDDKTGDGVPLVVTDPLHMDFRGLVINVRGPGGGKREQALAGSDDPWIGGWMYAFGNAGFDRLTVENVTVDGGYSGELMVNEARNLSDKGFRLQDTDIRELYFRNVELRNFAAEIYYIGGLGPVYQELEDCHFHGSPQAAFNPGGTGKLLAKNLQAGRAFQSCESVCGIGHTYIGCRFYDSGPAGATFHAGPKPIFSHRYPFWYTMWDGVGEPPYIEFRDTHFERHASFRFGSWTRGNVVLTDTPASPNYLAGSLHDIDLSVVSYCDKRRDTALYLSGPPDLMTQVPECPPGTYYTLPKNIRMRVQCLRTANAQQTGVRHSSAVAMTGGLLDAQSISVTVSGEARKASDVLNAVPGFAMPQVLSSGFLAAG